MIEFLRARHVSPAMLMAAFAGLCFSAAAEAEQMSAFNKSGYAFNYPQSWGSANAKKVAALALASPGDVPDDVAPEHMEISFSKSKAAICFYPVKDSASSAFKKKYGVVSDSVQSLKTLLAKRPGTPKDVPFLPWGDLATPFYAHVKYLDAKDKSALRFVGQYNTECVEINNAALSYTAQALSKNSHYYVSVSIPVSSKILPDKDSAATWKNDKYQQFMKSYDNYTAPIARKLNAESEAAFKPALADLDAVVNSISTPQE